MTLTPTVPGAALDDLGERLHGRLVRPAADDYDAARSVFNAMIDRRPAAIARCRDTADVAAGIAFARDHDLVLSVRGGGHNVAGNAVCDGGLMLDLSGMKALDVDPEKLFAGAGPGLTLGELDRGTQQHGLATPLGIVSATGIAGLTLGGGLGWLNGRYGLACDNLLGAEVVTADGEVLRIRVQEHPDLFWAIRGGGGNFGVVTFFTYRLHPVGPVLAGAITYPWQRVRQVLRVHEELVASAPNELSTAVSLGRGPDGQPMLSIIACWCGPVEDGARVLAPLRTAGPPLADTVGVIPYMAMQSAPDEGFPTGRLHYWKSGYLRHLTDATVDVLLEHVPAMPLGFSGVGLQRLHGAAARVPTDATAFPHRAEQYDLLILAQWADPADTDRTIAWARGLFEALRPHLQDAVYVNNLGAEGTDRVHAAYGPNLPRLAQVKQTYDPDNVFRMNQNIVPLAVAGA
ncbi:FAD-binding oxidoreductase [Blastococcus saxobsidens]|uniref:FAD/FMN-dependent dehydrogenase n=1 Tax=Blastococcus saxobsidens (strain DD2) TaxID=1146883 RepID=H6RRA2_BLASD|nr:FAD-binding oxidoreductase [Blastococcus saxobsidens]CCG04182.1 FAD/FMN-dependent dehydrogenase [Blastococcus saxobsidens DD2]